MRISRTLSVSMPPAQLRQAERRFTGATSGTEPEQSPSSVIRAELPKTELLVPSRTRTLILRNLRSLARGQHLKLVAGQDGVRIAVVFQQERRLPVVAGRQRGN